MTKFILTAAFMALSQVSYAICPEWTASQVGQLDRATINEASGLTASRMMRGKFIWSNDSSGASALFATGANGRLERTVRLNGFANEDYEALATGPCPSNSAESCLFLGDIGDGIGWRSNFKIGIFKERDFWANTAISPEKVIQFSYPGGANNAEAMVVTNDGYIIIFTKTEGSTQLFAIHSVTGMMNRIGQVNLSGIIAPSRGKQPRVTDASLSSDGEKVLILTYGDIMEIGLRTITGVNSRSWRRGVDYQILRGPGLPQQETISYVTDNSFIVSTESPDGAVPLVYQYACKGF